MSTASAPRVILKQRRALPLISRHPWVFAGAIDRIEGDPGPGAVVHLFTHEGNFVAQGIYNPTSQIQVRLYAWGENVSLDRDFWSQRLDSAIALRRHLFADVPEATSACRLVHSEADGLSGLTVDRYGRYLSIQFTSLALALRREWIVDLLVEKLKPAGVWLRTEKGILEREGLDLKDGLLYGEPPPRPLFIEEAKVRYGIDVAEGQKTGFYLDQRDNRQAVARYVAGHCVLDLFCYSGGFGLAAVKQGSAREVLAVDVSETALVLARANAELNEVADRFSFRSEKVFTALEALRSQKRSFDTVILDPPKMTHRRSGLKQALSGYFSLNRLAVDVVAPGGLLVTCSCSGLVTRDDFLHVLAQVSLRSGRQIQVLEARGAAADHPISVFCPENEYLKCFICRVE